MLERGAVRLPAPAFVSPHSPLVPGKERSVRLHSLFTGLRLSCYALPIPLDVPRDNNVASTRLSSVFYFHFTTEGVEVPKT